MRLVVITGGPCSGKTTLIEELARRKYKVVEEAAREILKMRGEKKQTTEEALLRQVLIFKKQLIDEATLEKECKENETVFLDRCLVDTIAYTHLFLGQEIEELKEIVFPRKYHKVFLLERLPIIQDEVRKEDETQAQKIHAALGSIYAKLGFEVIRVPSMPIKERADFVLQNL